MKEIIDEYEIPLTLVFAPDDKGGWSARVRGIPGVNSQGETLDGAREMVIEALHELVNYRAGK